MPLGTAALGCEWRRGDAPPCGRTDLAVDGDVRVCTIHVDDWIDSRDRDRAAQAEHYVTRDRGARA